MSLPISSTFIKLHDLKEIVLRKSERREREASGDDDGKAREIARMLEQS